MKQPDANDKFPSSLSPSPPAPSSSSSPLVVVADSRIRVSISMCLFKIRSPRTIKGTPGGYGHIYGHMYM